ncbi:MAG: type VII toxin-antitoxin system MntA family adenylyltransferase antitoxin, partial [Candidatus Binatia bacterium]
VGRLETALRDVAARGVVSAYVFGSRAEGREHRESDLDLGVLLERRHFPSPADRFEMRVRLSSWLPERLGGIAVDVVVLNDAPPLLGRRIVTRGRRVFCSDDDADHAFVRDVQLRAADLEPFLRRTRALKLAALGR